jgi:hypothetical protein
MRGYQEGIIENVGILPVQAFLEKRQRRLHQLAHVTGPPLRGIVLSDKIAPQVTLRCAAMHA